MKKIILILSFLCLLGLISGIFSYSRAMVRCSSDIKIVPSEKALISMDVS